MTDPNLQPMKLHARNLTARAAAVVRGNPVTTRPEDGVENCFPGLEFDQRDLDKVFLPGLSLEWHHGGGVIVRDFDPAGIAAGLITAADIASGLFLIAVRGVFASRLEAVAPAPDVRFVLPPAGLDAWRVVHDIEPGEAAVSGWPRKRWRSPTHCANRWRRWKITPIRQFANSRFECRAVLAK